MTKKKSFLFSAFLVITLSLVSIGIERLVFEVKSVSVREGFRLREKEAQTEEVFVARVIDGDTFEISDGTRVRLIGIDAPESVKPGSDIECFGKESSDYLRSRIEGKVVRLEKDISERDRYGRLLRYVFLDDVLVNKILVDEGYAYVRSFPPDVSRRDEFLLAEQEAKNEGRGLWGDDTCQGKRSLKH